jgi:uncharacterized protein YegL
MTTNVKPRTHVVLILDQSGSMSSIRDTAVTCYNELVQQAQMNSKDQDILVSLLTFNGDCYEHLWAVPANDLRQSTADGYACEGGTALNDALGYAVKKLLAGPDAEDKNTSFLVQVVTDGEENSSRHFPASERTLRDLVAGVQETGRWTFTFMGCSVSYLEKLAQQMAVPAANMAAFAHNNAAMGMCSNKVGTQKYFNARAGGQSASPQVYGSVAGQAADFQGTTPDMVNQQYDRVMKTAGVSLCAAASDALPQVNCFAGSESKLVDWSVLQNKGTGAPSTNQTVS